MSARCAAACSGEKQVGDDRVDHRQQPVVDARVAVPRVQQVIDAPVGVEIGEAGELAVGQQPLREVGTHLRGRRVQRRRRIRPAEAPQRRGKRGERLVVQRDGPTAAQSLAHRRDDRLQRIVPIAVPVRHEVRARDDARRDDRERPLDVPPHGGALGAIGSGRVEERHDVVENRGVLAGQQVLRRARTPARRRCRRASRPAGWCVRDRRT